MVIRNSSPLVRFFERGKARRNFYASPNAIRFAARQSVAQLLSGNCRLDSGLGLAD